MSTRLLLEGPDIETLLSRVRAEHGPRARIVAADKVRSGGLAGFFARERFEVQVELDEPEPDAAPSALATPSIPAFPGTPATPSVGTAEAGPASLLELAAAVDRIELAAAAPLAPDPAPEPAMVSTDTADFAELLTRLVAGAGPDETAALVPFQPAPAYAAATVAPPALPAAPAVPAEADPSPSVWAELGLPAHLCALAPRNPRDLAGLIDALGALPAAPRLHRTAGDVVVVMGDGLAALEVARTVARRLRVDPDGVLLAAPGGLAAAVATNRRLGGPVAARRRAGAMHRASTAAVVAVDAPWDDEGPDWAREVADALEATAVWAVVDATRKTADLAGQLDRLGRVDALAVRHARVSADPASVLALGRPVALLDGVAATARAWAALLHEKASAR